MTPTLLYRLMSTFQMAPSTEPLCQAVLPQVSKQLPVLLPEALPETLLLVDPEKSECPALICQLFSTWFLVLSLHLQDPGAFFSGSWSAIHLQIVRKMRNCEVLLNYRYMLGQ